MTSEIAPSRLFAAACAPGKVGSCDGKLIAAVGRGQVSSMAAHHIKRYANAGPCERRRCTSQPLSASAIPRRRGHRQLRRRLVLVGGCLALSRGRSTSPQCSGGGEGGARARVRARFDLRSGQMVQSKSGEICCNLKRVTCLKSGLHNRCGYGRTCNELSHEDHPLVSLALRVSLSRC